jgi:hypothetical protein
MKRWWSCFILTFLLLISAHIARAQNEMQSKWDAEAEAAVDRLHLDTNFAVQRSIVDGSGCRMVLTDGDVIYVVRCTGTGRDTGDELQGKFTHESGRMVIEYLGGGFRGIKPGSPVMHGQPHGPWRYNVVTATVLRIIR